MSFANGKSCKIAASNHLGNLSPTIQYHATLEEMLVSTEMATSSWPSWDADAYSDWVDLNGGFLSLPSVFSAMLSHAGTDQQNSTLIWPLPEQRVQSVSLAMHGCVGNKEVEYGLSDSLNTGHIRI